MLKRFGLLAAAAAAAAYAADSSSSTLGLGLGDDTSSSSLGYGNDLNVGVDDTSSSSTHGLYGSPVHQPVTVSTPSKNTLAALADLETILLKLIYKTLGTVGYTEKELGIEHKDEYHGYWYEVGEGSKMDKLYPLEAALARQLKEIGKVVGTKLQVAFGSKHYGGYSFEFVADGGVSGSNYENKTYEPHKDYPVSSPYTDHKYYSEYPVYLPPVGSGEDKVLLEEVKHKLEAIADLLKLLKALDKKSLQLIKLIKEILHAIKVARAVAAKPVSSPAHDSSSSSTAGLGAGTDDTSSSSATTGVGSGSGHGSTVTASPKLVKLLKALAKAEKALAATIKEEGKVAKKLQVLAFGLKALAEKKTHY